jgi:hypothetical protein
MKFHYLAFSLFVNENLCLQPLCLSDNATLFDQNQSHMSSWLISFFQPAFSFSFKIQTINYFGFIEDCWAQKTHFSIHFQTKKNWLCSNQTIVNFLPFCFSIIISDPSLYCIGCSHSLQQSSPCMNCTHYRNSIFHCLNNRGSELVFHSNILRTSLFYCL